MADESIPDMVTISDARLIRAIALSGAGTYLTAFVDGPTTVSAAAAALEAPLQRVHYWVRRLVDYGALQVVGSQRRRGRPMSLYRSVARSLHIPAELVPEGQYDRLSGELDRRTRRAIEAAAPQLAIDGDLVLGLSADGTFFDRIARSELGNVGRVRRPGIPAGLVTTWRTLELTDDEAAELATELWALADRYGELGRRRSAGRVHKRWLRIDLVPAL